MKRAREKQTEAGGEANMRTVRKEFTHLHNEFRRGIAQDIDSPLVFGITECVGRRTREKEIANGVTFNELPTV